MIKKLALPIAVTVLILTGCGPEIGVPTRVCPGKNSTSQALSLLRLRSRKAVPLKANGACRLEYYVEGKTKPKKEDIPAVKLWMNPPVEIYLQGNVAFNPRGIVLGSNEDEFWLWIKPKEISSYWRGLWSKNNYIQKLVLSPKIVLEAIGIAAVDGEQGDWSLSNEGPFDVLTRRSDTGLAAKKIYIYNCDYLVRKIEYFNEFGQVEIVAELARYKEVVEGFSAPTIIKVVTHTGRGKADSVKITLKSIKPAKITKKQSEFLFTCPPPRGFKNVYEVVNGKWIEQPQ